MRRSLRLVAGLSIALASPLAAQRIGTIELGAHAGFIIYDKELNYDNGPAIGAQLSMFVFPRVQVFVEDGWTPTTRTPVGRTEVDQSHFPFRTGFIYNIPVAARTYLGIGGGYSLDAYPDEETANQFEDGFLGVANISRCFGNDWRWKIEGLWDHNPSPNRQDITGTSNNITFRFGVSKLLNGNKAVFGEGRGVCAPAAAPAAAPPPPPPPPPAPPPPPPPPPAPPAPPPPPAPSQVFRFEGVNFDFDKATIRPEGRVKLDSAVTILRNRPEIRVELQGHTDNIGTEQYNQGLSERRAAAVKQYLVSKGINASRITTRGFGESQPTASNDTPEGRFQNRRVVIIQIN